MVFWFWKKKEEKEIEKLKNILKSSFFSVKNDLEKVGQWINYLNEKNKNFDEKIENLRMKVEKVEKEIEEIKEYLYYEGVFKQVFKQHKQVFKHQTGVEGVQTPVQTGVQTPEKENFLKNLTITERVIVWVLLNSDLKLSCEDIGRVLGKNSNTIRGQINNIKSKIPGLIEEIIEKNGKKRYFIEEKTKYFILKKLKVRVEKRKKLEKIKQKIRKKVESES
jgi:ElaB/YqjD/DUF883 family membrane-anchored ribosome-binding protein